MAIFKVELRSPKSGYFIESLIVATVRSDKNGEFRES